MASLTHLESDRNGRGGGTSGTVKQRGDLCNPQQEAPGLGTPAGIGSSRSNFHKEGLPSLHQGSHTSLVATPYSRRGEIGCIFWERETLTSSQRIP